MDLVHVNVLRTSSTYECDEECDEDIDGNKMVYNATLYDYAKSCRSRSRYVILLIIAFVLVIIGISEAYFKFFNVVSY